MTLQYMESSAQSQRPHRPLSHSKMTITTTQTKVKLSYPMMAMPLINHSVVHCCYLIEKHRPRHLHHLAELTLLQSSGASILATELMTILIFFIVAPRRFIESLQPQRLRLRPTTATFEPVSAQQARERQGLHQHHQEDATSRRISRLSSDAAQL